MAEPSNRGITFPEQQKKHEPSGVVETVKDKAQDLANSARDKAQDLAGSARDKAQDLAHSAQQAWDSGKQQAQRYASEVGDKVEGAFDDVQGFIRRYPVACVMGGFLIGCLFAGAVNPMNYTRR